MAQSDTPQVSMPDETASRAIFPTAINSPYCHTKRKCSLCTLAHVLYFAPLLQRFIPQSVAPLYSYLRQTPLQVLLYVCIDSSAAGQCNNTVDKGGVCASPLGPVCVGGGWVYSKFRILSRLSPLCGVRPGVGAQAPPVETEPCALPLSLGPLLSLHFCSCKAPGCLTLTTKVLRHCHPCHPMTTIALALTRPGLRRLA